MYKIGIFGIPKKIKVAIYSLFIFTLFFLTFRFGKKIQLEGVNHWVLPIAFSIKVLAGLLFLYIYTAHYGNGKLSEDAGNFFRESKIIHDVYAQSPGDYFKILTGIGYEQKFDTTYLAETTHWNAGNLTVINDTKNVMRVHSLLHFISFGSIYFHLLVFCAIGLLAFVQIHKAFSQFSTVKPLLFFAVIFLLPSALFWSSTTLKEPFSFLGIGLLMHGFFGTFSLRKKLMYIFFGVLLMLLFKSYLLVMMGAPILFYLTYMYLGKSSMWKSSFIFLGILGLASLLFWTKIERAVYILSRKQYDFTNVGKGGLHAVSDTCVYYFEPKQEKALKIEGDSAQLLKSIDAKIIYFGTLTEPVDIHLEPTGKKWFIIYHEAASDSYIPITLIENSPLKLVLNIPEALTNSMFRPFLGDRGGALKFPSIVELWGVFAFLLICIFYRRKVDQKTRGLIIALSLFAFSLFLLIGLITPVVGAIVRYRVPAQLSILLIGLIIVNIPKFSKK
ncbi:MAG: hypothetical protein V4638_07445 [Bacteroidota bacterium]